MPKRVVLVHGFNVKDEGRSTIGKLKPFLEELNLKVINFSYGWKGLLGVRFGSDKTARKLASIVEPGDIVIGHSNGCNLINTSAWNYQAPFEYVHYINPALDADMPLAKQVKRATVYHTFHDWTVRFSTILFAHDWGKMGQTGYKGPEERYVNVDSKAKGHSSIFDDRRWMLSISHRILDQHGQNI